MPNEFKNRFDDLSFASEVLLLDSVLSISTHLNGGSIDNFKRVITGVEV